AGVRRDAEVHEERALRLAQENERLETELEALSARVEERGPVEARPSSEQDAFEEEVPHKPIIAFDEFAHVAEEPDASVFPHSESLETADEATRLSEPSGAAGESRGSIYHATSMKRLSRRFSSQDEALRELASAQAQIRNYKHEVERLTAALHYVEETIRKGKGDKLKFMQFIVPRPLGTPDVWLRLYLDARERDERLVESQKKSLQTRTLMEVCPNGSDLSGLALGDKPKSLPSGKPDLGQRDMLRKESDFEQGSGSVRSVGASHWELYSKALGSPLLVEEGTEVWAEGLCFT
ncbi:hypothetical protein FOZ63_009452, partial [Perkinsus olseni]